MVTHLSCETPCNISICENFKCKENHIGCTVHIITYIGYLLFSVFVYTKFIKQKYRLYTEVKLNSNMNVLSRSYTSTDSIFADWNEVRDRGYLLGNLIRIFNFYKFVFWNRLYILNNNMNQTIHLNCIIFLF